MIELSKVVSMALDKGYQIAPEAFQMLSTLDVETDPETLVRRAIEHKGGSFEDCLLTKEDFESIFPRVTSSDGEAVPAMGEEVGGDMAILEDPTEEIAPLEAEAGFKRLFESRYQRLVEISRRRPDLKGLVSIESLSKAGEKQRLMVAGLLSSRRSKKESVEIVLDDPGGSVRVVCVDEASGAIGKMPLDSLVIAGGSKSKGIFFANSIVVPDIPSRRPVMSSHRALAVLLSDLHIGSKMFLADDFNRFLLWLNGKLGDLDMVSRVRYVLIAGDLVDGVGVYPGQEFQLERKALGEQYLMAAELIDRIPKSMKVVISPGNHDPVRQALPQPAFSQDLAHSLYAMSNVKLLGNPAYLKLNGVTFLMYHGRSLDDIIATVPELSYNRPAEAMQVLLKTRHLAPIYGKRTPLSPEARDMLVIDPVPDVFHAGHVHAIDSMEYRGTTLVNSGTWQAQTPFQANMGLEPTPCIVPMIDLSTLEIVKRSFARSAFN